jgi:hypothetical protein
MKQQFVITYTICQTEMPILLDSWVTNIPFCQNPLSTKNCFSLYFCKNILCFSFSLLSVLKCWSIKDLSSSYVYCETVHQWVTTNCCLMSITVNCFNVSDWVSRWMYICITGKTFKHIHFVILQRGKWHASISYKTGHFPCMSKTQVSTSENF